MRYTHDSWSIDLPNNWAAEESDECIAFYNPDGVGAIQISTYIKEDGDVTNDDLLVFSEAENPDEADLPYLNGIKKTIEDGGHILINWWLRSGQQLYYVSYICEKGNEAIEAKEREYVVYSLRPNNIQYNS